MGAIYLLRHGQASFGSSDYDQLSPLGQQQARVLGQALTTRGVQPDVVISGTLQRHRDTARGCLVAMNAEPRWDELPGVNEFDHEDVIRQAEPRYADRLVMMGEMAASGDPRRAFQAFFKGAVHRWVRAEAPGYAEPWAAFKQRCIGALDDIVRRTPAKGSTLVFTSGGTISVICAHLLGLDDEQAFTINWTLANAGITKLIAGRDGLHLLSVNEHAHVEGHEPPLLSYR